MTDCWAPQPCRCCLAAEVDDLKAQLISALAPAEPSYEELQAQVQRVEAMIAAYEDVHSREPEGRLSLETVAKQFRAALDGEQ
jgi:hypothetical protein